MNSGSVHKYTEARTLYVVLQGEFALFREKRPGADHDMLWIMAPDVSDHCYKAGPWLTDWHKAPELPRHRLRIRHIHGEVNGDPNHCGRATPESNTDIFMKLGAETLCPEEARVVITAPMPLAILPGRTESTPSVVISVKNGTRTTYPPVPPNPTVIPILVYKWYDGQRPDLWDEDDACSLFRSGGASDELQSIQIYASSPASETKCHAQAAFKAAAKLLGVEADIDWIGDDDEHDKNKKSGADYSTLFTSELVTPPPGLSWAQVNFFLYDVLDATQEDLASDTPVYPRVPKISSSGNCGPITG